MAAPKLEKRFTMRINLSPEHVYDLKAVRGHNRFIAAIAGGFIRGEGVEAEILPGGADWVSLDPSTLVSHVDVRTQARTSTGHYISVRYTGVMKSDDAIAKVIGWAEDAKTTQFGDHETWFTAPVFETSDPRLKWIESAVWVGRGRCVVDGDGEWGRAVEYEVLRVVN